MNGVTLGSVEDNGEDMSVKLKSDIFDDSVRVENILSIPITVGPITYNVGDFVDVEISNATASITREDGDIQITVDADVEDGVDTVSTQNTFAAYAKGYDFPSGISYKI